MGIVLRSFIRIGGRLLKYSLDKLTKIPHITQRNLLLNILRKNSGTEFGRTYNFNNISDEAEFRKKVPVNTYQDIEPYIKKIMSGQRSILTSDPPLIFNVTSGTSDKPKFIPVTINTKKRTTYLMQQWLYRTLLDHPSFLDKSNFTISASASEGHTTSGVPFGSLSGLIYSNLPRIVMRSYVLPLRVADIKSYDLRYYLMARLSFEKDVSFLATPNPTTLIKVAETGIRYQEEIIRSINDGCLFTMLDFPINADDAEIIKVLNISVKPNRAKAQFLSAVMKNNRTLSPFCCWPSLKLIGCWLGGSSGYQAEKLSTYYGNTPKRDIGYLASEGCITLPYEDCTPSGILALQNNYYEFIPVESASEKNPEVRLSHELETGMNYKVVLTNESGLYRYDMNDTVRVEKFYNQTPVLAFVRKTNDVLNITGEKLHVNQLIMAMQKVESALRILINQFRVVSNLKQVRYDIFMALGRDVSPELLKNTVLPAIDAYLSEMNIEYSQKRRSGRLNPPCLHVMDPAWEENIRKNVIESGKRDIQYKWQLISPEFWEIDKKYVKRTIYYGE
jgi:hypothetical protein